MGDPPSFSSDTLTEDSSDNEATCKDLMWEADITTGGANPAINASFHRDTHKHHRSPGTRPGKWGRRGVDKSFPFNLV